MESFVVSLVLFGDLLLGVDGTVSAESAALLPPLSVTSDFEEPVGERLTVFISDLHMGSGRRPDGRWSYGQKTHAASHT